MCLPDYSTPVIMLTCVNPKQPCSCFRKPHLERNSPYLQPQSLMPFPDPCQWPLCPAQAPQTSMNLSSPPWVCHLLSTPPFLFSRFLTPLNLLISSMFLACCFAQTYWAQWKLNKSPWIADGRCSETRQRCSTFTLLLFNCLFNSVEVSGSVCYTAPHSHIKSDTQ